MSYEKWGMGENVRDEELGFSSHRRVMGENGKARQDSSWTSHLGCPRVAVPAHLRQPHMAIPCTEYPNTPTPENTELI